MDKIIETVAITILILLWISVIVFYPKLPEVVPNHFNSLGEADQHGNKMSILILPVIATLIYLILSFLNKRPHIFNYHTTITEENAQHLYTSSTRLLRVIKLVVLVILSVLTAMIFKTAFADQGGIGAWFLPSILVLLVLPNIIFLWKIVKRT